MLVKIKPVNGFITTDIGAERAEVSAGLGTDRLYSGRFLIYKAVYAVLAPVAVQLAATLADPENALVLIFFAVFFTGVLYAVPFMLTVRALKRQREYGIARFIGLDAAYLLFPEAVSIVVSEAFLTALDPKAEMGQGFFSILAISVTVVITLCFWLIYFVVNKSSKKPG